jgi:hypothetical protein
MKKKKRNDPLIQAIERMNKDNNKTLRQLAGSINKLGERINGTQDLSRDGRAGVREIQPVREASPKSNNAVEAGRVDRPRGTREDSKGYPEQAEKIDPKIAEQALNTGLEGAVSSFTPHGAPPPGSLPTPDMTEKILFRESDTIQCLECKRPIYVAKKDITTFAKLSQLLDLLEPYGPDVPLLTPETPVRKVKAALNCPLCLKEWGVLICG